MGVYFPKCTFKEKIELVPHCKVFSLSKYTFPSAVSAKLFDKVLLRTLKTTTTNLTGR